jgi:hypothetical protein
VEAFRYPSTPRRRRHGPRGYRQYESFRLWLRDEFEFRCVYCLAREQWGRVSASYDLDHFVAAADDASGALDYDNLVYACRSCNSAKARRPIPDPLVTLTDEQVVVFPDGNIEGRSLAAKELIRGLSLDSPENVAFRQTWISVIALAERYDNDLFRRLMGYPSDLPQLSRLRPPGGNLRPGGIEDSHFRRREQRTLAALY